MSERERAGPPPFFFPAVQKMKEMQPANYFSRSSTLVALQQRARAVRALTRCVFAPLQRWIRTFPMRRDLAATLLLVALLFAFPLHVLQASNSGRISHETNRTPVVTDGGLPAARRVRGAPAICADDKSSIPRIVHQSWKEKRPPPPLEPLSARWRSLSGWEYRLWTDEDNERLWKEHAPELIDVFSAYNDTPHTVRDGHVVGASVREGYEIQRPTGIRRADASRLLYMHVHGGVYADLDVIPCAAGHRWPAAASTLRTQCPGQPIGVATASTGCSTSRSSL